MNKLLSNCCQKPVRTAWSQDFGDEPKGKKPPAGATCFMICDGCNKVCDTHEDSDIHYENLNHVKL